MNNCVISINKCRDKDSLEYYTSKIDSIQNGIDKVNVVYANLESIVNSGGKLPSREYYKQVASLEQVTGWYTFEPEVLPKRASLESLSTTRGYISTEDLKVSMEGLGKWLVDLIKKLIDWIKGLFGFGKKQTQQQRTRFEAAKTRVKKSVDTVEVVQEQTKKAVERKAKKKLVKIVEKEPSRVIKTDDPVKVKEVKKKIVEAKKVEEIKEVIPAPVVQQVVEETKQEVVEEIKKEVENNEVNVSGLVIGDATELTPEQALMNAGQSLKVLKHLYDKLNDSSKGLGNLVRDIDEGIDDIKNGKAVDFKTMTEKPYGIVDFDKSLGLTKEGDPSKYTKTHFNGAILKNEPVSSDKELFLYPAVFAGNVCFGKEILDITKELDESDSIESAIAISDKIPDNIGVGLYKETKYENQKVLLKVTENGIDKGAFNRLINNVFDQDFVPESSGTMWLNKLVQSLEKLSAQASKENADPTKEFRFILAACKMHVRMYTRCYIEPMGRLFHFAEAHAHHLSHLLNEYSRVMASAARNTASDD